MDRSVLIKNTLKKIKLLPDIKIQEINDLADFLLSKTENKILQEGLQNIASDSKSFDFLIEEENLYSVNDIKEKYK